MPDFFQGVNYEFEISTIDDFRNVKLGKSPIKPEKFDILKLKILLFLRIKK